MRVGTMSLAKLALLVISICSVRSFAPVAASKSFVQRAPSTIKSIPRGGTHPSALFSFPFVGSEAIQSTLALISSNIQSGPFGVLSLWAVTWSVVLPLTLYKKMYGIGVAYGYSVFAAGLTMLQLFPDIDGLSPGSLLAKVCIFYGFRLGTYLLIRDAVRKETSTVKNGSITSRIIFSLSLSLFYALLVTPTLYACRDSSFSSMLALAGASLAWLGAIMEAIADAHKLVRKAATKDLSSQNQFVGPTTWTYRVCRHPNYLGEVLMWAGLFIGGVPSFGTSITGWLCSSLGLVGIVSIMTKATEGLEKRQSEKYNGQEAYEKWKKDVKSPLFPFVES